MLLRDFVYGGRVLLKNPLFSASAILTIAIGIGASTAMFGVVNTVLLRALPYSEPDRLVLVSSDLRKRGVTDFPFSNANFIDLRNAAKTNLAEMGAITTGRTLWAREDGTPEQIRTAGVTPNFMRMMGARIIAGRDFVDADGEPPPPAQAGQAAQQAPAAAILSHEFWQRRYGGSMEVLGRRTANNGPLIVGVLAAGMEVLLPPKMAAERRPDIWFASRLVYDNAQRSNVSLRVIGRLKQNASVSGAQAECESIIAGLRKSFPIMETSGFAVRVEPMKDYLVAEVRPAIIALMGAVVFLLLIACANVANLLLVRTSLRERELAVRAALGGSRWRLIQQMLVESVLVSGVAAVLGVGLAMLGNRTLMQLAPANLPRLDAIGVDPMVVAFAALIGLAATALFGIVPALRASRPDLVHALRASGRTAALSGGSFLRSAVVVAEVALSFVLLIGSGLMFRSFLALQNTDPGFESKGLLTFFLSGNRDREPQQRAAFVRELQQRLNGITGVQAVTLSRFLPLDGGFSPIRWGLEQALSDLSAFQAVDHQVVQPGYFELFRTPLIAGRYFTEQDNMPDRNIAVIDSLLAAKAFPGAAIGKRMLVRLRTLEPEWVEVIGVVKHVRSTSLAEPGREQVYFTSAFVSYAGINQWTLRVTGNPASYASAVRSAVAAFAPQTLITGLEPVDEVVSRSQSGTRFSLALIGVFALLAVSLAGIGLYSVLATLVRQRTAEIGVRMAMGAPPARIFGLVVGQGLRLTAIGVAAGLTAAIALTRVMTGMLTGVKPTDPATFVSMAMLFFAIAVIACWIPARRAAGLDPTRALRDE